MSRSGLLPSNPIETFMKLFRLSFPDAPGCAAIYYSKIDDGLRLAWLDQENEYMPFQSRIVNTILINKKIRDIGINRQISWHKFSPLPSEIRKVLRNQPEMFESGMDDILIFRNQNIHDEKMDLLFFDFGKWMLTGKKSKGYDLSDEKVKKNFCRYSKFIFQKRCIKTRRGSFKMGNYTQQFSGAGSGKSAIKVAIRSL